MKKTLLLFLTFTVYANFASAQWQQIGLDSTYVGALTINGDTIFAGTTLNGVYISTNKGSSWTAINTGMPTTQIYVLAKSGSNIFVGTEDGIYLSTNNGDNWTAMNNGLPANTEVYSIAIRDSNVFAGTYHNGIFLSTNNGQLWTSVDSGLIANDPVYKLAIDGNNIFAGTYDGLFLSSNNGSTWTNIGLTIGSVMSLAIDGSNIFAGTLGGVYLSSNNGLLWSGVNTGMTNTIVHALAINGNYIFVGTQDGVFFSNNNGQLWYDLSTGLPNNLSVVSFALSGDTLYAGAQGVWKLPLLGVGIAEKNNENIISVYPNPAISNLTIETMQRSTIVISNLQGQNLFQQQLLQGKTAIDIGILAKGIYILRLNSNNKTAVTKIVKE